jgi:hypothetical protein
MLELVQGSDHVALLSMCSATVLFGDLFGELSSVEVWISELF